MFSPILMLILIQDINNIILIYKILILFHIALCLESNEVSSITLIVTSQF